jgi:hypothetical protein
MSTLANVSWVGWIQEKFEYMSCLNQLWNYVGLSFIVKEREKEREREWSGVRIREMSINLIAHKKIAVLNSFK